MALTSSQFAAAMADLIDQFVAGELTAEAFTTALQALYEGENLTTESLALEVSRLVATVKDRLLFGPVAVIASAATTDLGAAASHLVEISGNTNISSLGDSALLENPLYELRFTGTPTLVHSASLDLPGNTNLVITAGTVARALYRGDGAWLILGVARDDATLVSLAAVDTAADQVIYATGSDTFSVTSLTAAARTFIAQTTQALMRTAGLGMSAIGSNIAAAADAAAVKILLGLNLLNNTADADKPVSTAQQAALDLKANKSTTVTGGGLVSGGGDFSANRTLTVTEASDVEALAGADGTKAMTPRRVKTAIDAAVAGLLDSTPGALDTLNELAAALGDDPNFASTIIAALAGKQPIDATLTALAGVATGANKLIYATGTDAFAAADLSAVARTLLAQTTQALMRTAGLGMSANGSSLVSAADYAAMRALLGAAVAEEGSWTPSLTFGGAFTGWAVYEPYTFGRYVKIGRTVFIEGAVWILTEGSATGQAYVSGLPFTAAGDNIPTGIVSTVASLATVATLGGVNGMIVPGSTTVQLQGVWGGLVYDTDFDVSTGIRFSGFYRV